MRPSSVKRPIPAVWRGFVSALVAIGMFFSAIVVVIHGQDVRHQRELFEREARHVLELQRELLEFELRSVRSDLLYLAGQAVLDRFAAGDLSARAELEAEYGSFARTKMVYDQVRVLHPNGQELVRINYDAGSARVVPSDRLQSKATRYYHRQALSLDEGEVFVTPFDLNIEHESIQRPIKPVIRFSTPVFDGARQLRGVLVLNYVGARLIAKLGQIAAGFRGDTVLLNPAGEYLRATDPRREWGWLLGHEHSFRGDFPDAWRRGLELGVGQFRQSGDLFTFLRVSASRLARDRDAVELGTGVAPDRQSDLILVSHVSSDVESAHSRDLLIQLAALWVGAMSVVSLLLLYWARSRASRARQKVQIAESESRLRRLSKSFLAAQENERRNISRDLHDELGQQVTAIGLDLRSLAKKEGARASPLLQRAIDEIDRLLQSLHKIAARVRPSILDDLGLHDAVESYLDDYRRRTHIEVDCSLRLQQERIPAQIGENAYRVLQEALANVASHAETKRVEVRVEVDRRVLHMTVQDCGEGFDIALLEDSPRLGILGMRERVELLEGEFDLTSCPGAGTRIRIAIPLGEST